MWLTFRLGTLIYMLLIVILSAIWFAEGQSSCHAAVITIQEGQQDTMPTRDETPMRDDGMQSAIMEDAATLLFPQSYAWLARSLNDNQTTQYAFVFDGRAPIPEASTCTMTVMGLSTLAILAIVGKRKS